jgi:hypothetical protein
MTEIKSIKVEIAGKTLELSPEQAKELRDILDDIYPSRAPHCPQPYPVYIERYSNPYYPSTPYIWWQTTCGSEGTVSISQTH